MLLNSRTTPKLPVAIGVAMSAAFPFMFPPIPWKKEWGLYNGNIDLSGNLMSDGSLVGNFPLRYFISNEPYIIELRGGNLLDIKKTLFLRVDESSAPPMVIFLYIIRPLNKRKQFLGSQRQRLQNATAI